MSEYEVGFELLDKKWKEAIQYGVMECLDNAELWFTSNAESETPPLPLDFSPYSITQGMDERSILELDDIEKAYIQQQITTTLGFREAAENLKDEYTFSSPDNSEWGGDARVEVFRTPRSQEGLFVHKVTYQDSKTDYVVAPDEYRF